MSLILLLIRSKAHLVVILGSSGVGTLISQENSPNLQDQYFITTRITREPGLMLFLSKTKTFIIHGCSISHPSINFPFLSSSIVGGFVLVLLLRFSQNLSLVVLNYLRNPITPKDLLAFSPLLIFFNEFALTWIVQWDHMIIEDESSSLLSLRRTFKTMW